MTLLAGYAIIASTCLNPYASWTLSNTSEPWQCCTAFLRALCGSRFMMTCGPESRLWMQLNIPLAMLHDFLERSWSGIIPISSSFHPTQSSRTTRNFGTFCGLKKSLPSPYPARMCMRVLVRQVHESRVASLIGTEISC
jgi:hypothetical protein